MSSFSRGGEVRRKTLPTSSPISIPSTFIINSNLDWSLPPSSPLSPLNSHHTASPPTDLPVDIRPGSPNSLLSVPMLNVSAKGSRVSDRLPNPNLTSPLSPTPSSDLSSPETIQFALPSDFETEQFPSDDEGQRVLNRGGEKKKDVWQERPGGYASDSLSTLRTRQHRRIVPPLFMLNHKRSSSSGLTLRSSSLSASPSPVATHSRFHSQYNVSIYPPKDSFIDLEDTLDDLTRPTLDANAMYPTPPRRYAAGLSRHKQSGSVRSVASASSSFPTFVDPSGEDTSYQALPPPSPGLNVPFGGGIVNSAPPASTAAPPNMSNAWKMFSRDKEKEKLSKKKDFSWRMNSDDISFPNDNNSNVIGVPSLPHLHAPSSPTLLKPPKSKHLKKAAKLKFHTYPSENSSPPSSSPVLPLSSHPIPLPFPLPLPPTTNNLDPTARQDLIKKHRKLVKVLGEEPRVVGHSEFIGGSPLSLGQGSGLGTSSWNHHHHHHHHAASVSVSPFSSNLSPLPHRPRKEKNAKRTDWEANLNDKDNKRGFSGKEKSQHPTWTHNEMHNVIPHSHHHHHTEENVNLNNELNPVLNNAHTQILRHDADGGDTPLSAYDAFPAYHLKRRHSTPVTSEFIVDEAELAGSKSKPSSKKPNDNQKREEKKSRNQRQVELGSESRQAVHRPLEPILVSPASSVPSAPTSPHGLIFGSPISDLSFSSFPPTHVSVEKESDLLSRESLTAEEKRLQQSSNAQSQVIVPYFSLSPPPGLGSLPRLKIGAGFFDNSSPFGLSAPDSPLSTAQPTENPVPSLCTDTELKDVFRAVNSENKGGAQGPETGTHTQIARKDPLAPHIIPPPAGSLDSHHYSIVPPPHKTFDIPLLDQIPESEDKVKVKATLSPPSITSSFPLSARPTEVTAKAKAKERSRSNTQRSPVGPTFVALTSTTPNPYSEIEERDTKNRYRHTHTRIRSESPESFMDLGDDIETPTSPDIPSETEASQHQARKGHGTFGESTFSGARPNPVPQHSLLSPSPLPAMSTLPAAMTGSQTRSTAKTSLEVSASKPFDKGASIHRRPSTISLSPSLASLLSVQTTSTSPDDGYPYALTSEQDKRKKMDKLAKLTRFLGDAVPVELVLGEAYVFKDGDLPALAITDGAASNKRPLWMRRRRSSSSAALPGYEVLDRRKDDLDSKERVKHVRRGVKMEQMFGTRPPPGLYQVHPRGTGQQAASSTVPNSPTSPTPSFQTKMKGNMNSSSYKGKSRYSALGYSPLIKNADSALSNEPIVGGIDYSYANRHHTSDGSLDRSLSSGSKARRESTPLPSLFTPFNPVSSGHETSSRRRGSGDSNKPLLAFGQDIPSGGRLRDEAENAGASAHNPFESENGPSWSSVYMQYRQSLISLGDIVDKDDKASLAEFRQYLQLPHTTSRTGLAYGYAHERGDNEYDSYDSSDEADEYTQSKLKDDDAPITPTGSRSPNTPQSTKGEPAHSPPLTRRRSLPSRASTLSLVSTLSGTSMLSSISGLSIGTTATSFSKGLADIPGYYDAPRTEAEGRAAMFKARRRRAAKLTNFFGVKYRDLFGEVLESIEAGMREDVRAGRMGTVELEELMMRVKRLRLRKNQFN